MSLFGKIRNVRKKGVIDLVTEADIAAETAVIDVIRSRYPDHGILAEESGIALGTTPVRWIIDPLDGTTNFAHRLPVFAVSIAAEKEGEVVAGCVLNPATRECFYAAKGQGAFCNDTPLAVSRTDSLEDALLVTGFPYDLHDHFADLTKRFADCLYKARGVRRLGAAALDLCYVADGRFDGFWEENLKPWDTAAGALIAREAGARITDFSGNPFSPFQNQILATNGRIHVLMQNTLEPT